MPRAPPPPALLTRTTGTPRFAASWGWMSRIAVSVGPPGAKGMMNSTGRVGYDWAHTLAEAAPTASAVATRTARSAIFIGSLLVVDEGERPRAHLLRGAAERVPFGQPGPYFLPRLLSFAADRREVDTGNPALAHAHDAVDDQGLDVVADAALHETLDRIAHGAEAQGIAPAEIDDQEIGFRPRGQPAEIVAPEGTRAA